MASRRRGCIGKVVTTFLVLAFVIGLSDRVSADQIEFAAPEAQVAFANSISFSVRLSQNGRTIREAHLLYKIRGDNYSNLGLAVGQGRDSMVLNYSLDVRRFFLAPGSQLDYYWEILLPDGSVVTSPIASVEYTDQRFQWQRVLQGKVTVLWYSGSDGFSQKVAATASDAYYRLAASFRVDPVPITIFSYRSTSDLAGALPAGSAEWIGGQTFPAQGIIMVALANDESEMRRVIPHEVAHVVTWLASRNPYNDLPRWLDEGLAVSQELTDKGAYDQTVARALSTGTLPSVRTLNSNFAYQPDVARLSYAASYSFVSFLSRKYGDAKVVELVRSFQVGLDYDEAVEMVLGQSLDQLNREWMRTLTEGSQEEKSNPLQVSVLPVVAVIVLIAMLVSFIRRYL